MALGKKYTIQSTDGGGTVDLVELWEEGFAASSTELRRGANPDTTAWLVETYGSRSGHRYTPLVSTQIEIYTTPVIESTGAFSQSV